jgi:hypothetical protein
MANSPVDRNANIMKNEFGTNKLATDYGWEEKMETKHDFLDNLANHQHQILLRELDHEKNRKNLDKFKKTNNLHEKIRNDEDYDDWEYGTEPLFG